MACKDIDMIVEYDRYVIASKTDADGVITYVSRAFADISGYTVEEMVGKKHNIVRHPDMPKNLYKYIWETIKAGRTWQGEIKNRKKDGGFYWVFANITPLFEDDKIVGYSSVRKDITAEKFLMNINKSLEYIVDQKVKENLQKDKLLVKQSKLAAMGEMIDAIAHQWKNPLSTVDLIAQKIKNKIKNKKLDVNKLDEDMDDILLKTNHLVETINEFRNFFRPHAFVEKVNIKAMIDSTLILLSDELKSHRIKTFIHGNTELSVLINQNEFKHVLINLIQNSKDAFEENDIKDKEIIFEIIREKETIRLDITDNAGGIDKETIKKIFKPHFTTKENGKGTGIGLYLTQQIVEKNHAMMEVESKGSNTRFSLTFEIK